MKTLFFRFAANESGALSFEDSLTAYEQHNRSPLRGHFPLASLTCSALAKTAGLNSLRQAGPSPNNLLPARLPIACCRAEA